MLKFFTVTAEQKAKVSLVGTAVFLSVGMAATLIGLVMTCSNVKTMRVQQKKDRVAQVKDRKKAEAAEKAILDEARLNKEWREAFGIANPKIITPQVVEPEPEAEETPGKKRLSPRRLIIPPTPPPSVTPTPQVKTPHRRPAKSRPKPTPKPFKWPWEKPTSTR